MFSSKGESVEIHNNRGSGTSAKLEVQERFPAHFFSCNAIELMKLGTFFLSLIGSCMGGELSKREGVLFHWWPFISKRSNKLQLFYTDISLI